MASNILANDRFPFPLNQNQLERLSTTKYFILFDQLITLHFGQMRRDLLVIRFHYTTSKNATIPLDYLNSLITMWTKNQERRHFIIILYQNVKMCLIQFDIDYREPTNKNTTIQIKHIFLQKMHVYQTRLSLIHSASQLVPSGRVILPIPYFLSYFQSPSYNDPSG